MCIDRAGSRIPLAGSRIASAILATQLVRRERVPLWPCATAVLLVAGAIWCNQDFELTIPRDPSGHARYRAPAWPPCHSTGGHDQLSHGDTRRPTCSVHCNGGRSTCPTELHVIRFHGRIGPSSAEMGYARPRSGAERGPLGFYGNTQGKSKDGVVFKQEFCPFAGTLRLFIFIKSRHIVAQWVPNSCRYFGLCCLESC